MNAEQIADHLVRWMRAEVEASGARGLVVGLSGGVDSAVVACLARNAFRDTHVALTIPIESDPSDLADAHAVVEHFHLNAKDIALDEVYDKLEIRSA